MPRMLANHKFGESQMIININDNRKAFDFKQDEKRAGVNLLNIKWAFLSSA